MNGEDILTDYIERAMSYAGYEDLEGDSTFAGTIHRAWECLRLLRPCKTVSTN